MKLLWKRTLILTLCAALLAGTGCADKNNSVIAPTTTTTTTEAPIVLSAPANLSAVTAVGRVTLSWNDVTHADGYQVFGYDTETKQFVLLEDCKEPYATFSGLPAGPTCNYVVTAYANTDDGTVYSEQSDTIRATILQGVPNAPEQLIPSLGVEEITLTWGAVEGAEGYEVFLCDEEAAPYDSDVQFISVANTTSCMATVTGLAGGVTYSIYVQAYTNESGFSEYSQPSTVLTVTPYAAKLDTPVVTATPGDYQAMLQWEAVPDATGYRIRRLDADQEEICAAAAGTNVFTVTGLENDVTYQFTVQAYKTNPTSADYSAVSEPVSVTPALQPPGIPANVVASAGDGQIVLSWGAVPDANAYQIFQYNSSAGSYQNIRTVRDATTTTLTGLVNGSAYTYAVKAVRNIEGVGRYSELSAQVTATPVAATTAPIVTTAPTAPTTTVPTAAVSSSNGAYAAEVLRLVNEYRAANGLAALTENTALNSAANARAAEVAQVFSHTRPDGSSCFSILAVYNVSWSTTGENIAQGQLTPNEVVTAWMNSEGHRANILNAAFTTMATGYDAATNSWVQLFIG